MLFDAYETDGYYDEWLEKAGAPRPEAAFLVRLLEELPDGELAARQRAAERALLRLGITFNVYGHQAGTEKVWPFDLLPRRVAPRTQAVRHCECGQCHRQGSCG